MRRRRGHELVLTGAGRAGDAEYREDGLRLALWWELTVEGAWIWAPSPESWDAHWRARGAGVAAGRRAEILERVGHEAARLRAPRAEVIVEDGGVRLRF